jgi:GH25 family lysozyme M1 (1,4-beta-N-acetylmuramidase)
MKKILIISMLVFIISSIRVNAVEPASDDYYEGIDVSTWQGYIDFEKVKNAGIDIVYIEATIGKEYKDPYFELDYENAKLNGLKVGVYHYLTARSITEAKQEARFFASSISGKNIDCKLAMDFEDFGDLSNSEINDISIAFLEELENLTGKETILYSDLYNSQNVFKLPQKYPLWIAYYGPNMNLQDFTCNWNVWEGRQYTDIGNIQGIQGYVDQDIFTKEILLDDNSEIKEVKSEIIETNSSDRTEYTVKYGNTLWQIANEYNTSITEIANLNMISNPNLIYIGQKLTIITNTNFEKTAGAGKTFYTVILGDTLYDIAIRYNTTVENIVKINQIQNPNLIYVGQRIRI